MVRLRFPAAVPLLIGLFGLFVGGLGLAGLVHISGPTALIFLIGGLGFFALGLQFPMQGRAFVNLNRPTVSVRRATPGDQPLGVTSSVTTRTERIAIRNVNGVWTIDVSGDPLAAKNPEVQRQIIDELRKAGTVPQHVLDAVAAKLAESQKSNSADGGI